VKKPVENLRLFDEKSRVPVETSTASPKFHKSDTRFPQKFPFVSSLRGRRYEDIDRLHKTTTTGLRSDLSEERKTEIVDGLLLMCRRGQLGGVWRYGNVLRIRFVLVGPPEVITWREAAELTEGSTRHPILSPRKPPAPVVGILAGAVLRKGSSRA
jgi:hypothetical protein